MNEGGNISGLSHSDIILKIRFETSQILKTSRNRMRSTLPTNCPHKLEIVTKRAIKPVGTNRLIASKIADFISYQINSTSRDKI